MGNPSGRAFEGVGLLSFTCWDCRFEFRWGLGFLSFVIVMCCQAEICV